MRIVTNLERIDIQEWRNFVTKHPNGSIFLTPEMFYVYEKTPNYKPTIVVCIDTISGFFIGLLVAVRIQEKKGVVGSLTSRSIIIGCPLTNGDPLVAKKIMESYEKNNHSKGIYTQIRNLFNQSDFLSTFEGVGYKFEDHLNILLDLNNNDGDIWKGYSNARKRGVKKALKSNFLFQASNELSEVKGFYQLLSESYSRIKLPYPPKEHFEAIFSILNPDDFKCFSLSLDGVVCASLVTLVYKKRMYGYYMGLTSNNDILKLRPSDLLFHKVFEWCIANEVNTFDWMGAGKPNKEYGVRDFKLQFGGVLYNFGRYAKIHNLVLYKLGKTAIKLWRILK